MVLPIITGILFYTALIVFLSYIVFKRDCSECPLTRSNCYSNTYYHDYSCYNNNDDDRNNRIAYSSYSINPDAFKKCIIEQICESDSSETNKK
jgi:hypothetical protein